MRAPKAKFIYSVHPSVAMVQKWRATLEDKTGRSLDEWLALVNKSGPADENKIREWLKKDQGLGANTAYWIADHAVGKGSEMDSPAEYLKTADRWVAAMFAGPKAALLPLYEELLRLGASLGADVRISPCQTIVPFYRNHVFAQVKPSTATRLDFGFALGARQPQGRLIETGGYAKKDRITHRIAISKASDIDNVVRRWLRVSYDEDAA